MPWLVLALGADPYADMSSDIVATRDVAASPERVSAMLVDLSASEALWDASCAARWEAGATSRGVGAFAELRWTPGPMNRRLVVKVVAADERKVKWEGLGDRGFFVVWRLAPEGSGTRVVVETPLLPPPWPVRGLFFHKVQPAWRACYEEALARVDEVLP